MSDKLIKKLNDRVSSNKTAIKQSVSLQKLQFQ
jgi:hypothetical protein